MARTPYNEENACFSDKAHFWAQHIVYPRIFNADHNNLTFESTLLGSSDRNNILDGEMAVDRIVRVTKKSFRGEIQFTVQERFRRIQYARWRDITITEWNHNSNLPSELYKINAGMFLYGYCDERKRQFGEIVLVNTAALLYKLVRGEIDYDTGQNGKNQDFITLTFEKLALHGLIMCSFSWSGEAIPLPDPGYCRPRMYKWAERTL